MGATPTPIPSNQTAPPPAAPAAPPPASGDLVFNNMEEFKGLIGTIVKETVADAIKAAAPPPPKPSPIITVMNHPGIAPDTADLEVLEKYFKEKFPGKMLSDYLVDVTEFKDYRMKDPLYRSCVRDFLISELMPIKAMTPKMFEDREKAIKAMSIGTAADGGYLVPTGLYAEILYAFGDYSALRRTARVVPMDGAKLDYPTASAGLTSYWPGENVAITDSKPTLGEVPLSANPHGALVVLPRQLVFSSKIDIVALIRDLGTEALAYGEEDKFVNGDGTACPKGFRDSSYSSILTHVMTGALTYADLVHIKYSLAKKYRRNAKWLFSSLAMQTITGMVDDQKRPIWSEPVGGEPGRVLGQPYEEIEAIPSDQGTTAQYTTEIWYGDWRFYVWGDQMTMVVESSTEADDYFKKHQMGIKLIEYVDGQLGNQAAVTFASGVY